MIKVRKPCLIVLKLIRKTSENFSVIFEIGNEHTETQWNIFKIKNNDVRKTKTFQKLLVKTLGWHICYLLMWKVAWISFFFFFFFKYLVGCYSAGPKLTLASLTPTLIAVIFKCSQPNFDRQTDNASSFNAMS